MSLSTQLTRGTLALPMLALFGMLALAAGQAADAEAHAPTLPPVAQPSATVSRIELAQSRELQLVLREAGRCGAHARPQLLLAQAPADLGPIAQRQAGACRA